MIELASKTALVTGGSRGIGAAISKTLAAAGAHVVILDRSDWQLPESESCSGWIRAAGGSAESLELDVSDSVAVDRVFARIEEERGIDILVNNAGALAGGTVLETTDEVWRQQFSVNVDGTFYCLRAGIRAMVTAGRRGKVVNISSIAGLRANPGFAAYCSAKAAVSNLTRQAGIDFAPHGINVNAVAPGFIETDMTKMHAPEVRRVLEEHTPIGHWGQPRDVANAVAFLASSLSDHICGDIIAVDGGWTVGTPVVVPETKK